MLEFTDKVIVPEPIVDRNFRLPIPFAIQQGMVFEFPIVVNGTEVDRIKITIKEPLKDPVNNEIRGVLKMELEEMPKFPTVEG